MKKIIAISVILSLFLLGCSTEVVEEEPTVEEQIDEVQAVVEEAIEETETEPIVEEIQVDESIIEEPVVKANTEELLDGTTTKPETTTGTTHLVEVNLKGFDPATITIKAGDTIQWENVRSGNLNKVLIVGSSPCTKSRSAILMPGETYSWTFEEPVKCVFTDAIAITQLMKVIVE